MNVLFVCSIISLILYAILYDWTYIFLFSLVFGGYLAIGKQVVPFSASKFNNMRRKLGIATWSDPDSPECHGHMKVKMENAQRFIEDFFQKNGKKLTITQITLKAVADALSHNPDMTGKIAFGCYVPFETVDISCLVSLEGGKDLSFINVSEADKKSLVEIWNESQSKLDSIRAGDALKMHKKASNPFKLLPSAIGGILMDISSFIAIPLGLDLPMWGLKKHPLGSMVITNVGSGGFQIGYAPFPSILRVPGVLALSSIRDEARVEDGKIVIVPTLTILFTLDHRFGDGTRALKVINSVKHKLEHPHDSFSLD